MTPEEDIEKWIQLNRKLRAQIDNLCGLLDQARLTISLYNDILRNKGDYSRDGWTNHMLLEIDRALHPDWFANAPAVLTDNQTQSNEKENV